MAQIDPLKLVRNTASLEAYRQHQRAVVAAGQPWGLIGIVAAILSISLNLYGLFHLGFRHQVTLLWNLLFLVFALSSGVAGIRTWRYLRSHPFELPEAERRPWI